MDLSAAGWAVLTPQIILPGLAGTGTVAISKRKGGAKQAAAEQ